MIPRFARVSAHERNKRTSYIVVVIDLSDLISNLLVVGNAISFFFSICEKFFVCEKFRYFLSQAAELSNVTITAKISFFFLLEEEKIDLSRDRGV